jgi:hypothetical protein
MGGKRRSISFVFKAKFRLMLFIKCVKTSSKKLFLGSECTYEFCTPGRISRFFRSCLPSLRLYYWQRPSSCMRCDMIALFGHIYELAAYLAPRSLPRYSCADFSQCSHCAVDITSYCLPSCTLSPLQLAQDALWATSVECGPYHG